MSHSGRGSAWRPRIILWTFDLLYRNTALYWLASTIPFAGRWRAWQWLALPRLRGDTVLELGCGPGWLLADMVAAGYQCQGYFGPGRLHSSLMVCPFRESLAGSGCVTCS